MIAAAAAALLLVVACAGGSSSRDDLRLRDAPKVAHGPGTRVAVFDVDENTLGLAANTRSVLCERIAIRASKVLGFDVVPRDELAARIALESTAKTGETGKTDAKIGKAPCTDVECRSQIAKSVGASAWIATKIIALRGDCMISMTIVDTETAQAARGASARSSCHDDGLAQALEAMIGQLGAPRD